MNENQWTKPTPPVTPLSSSADVSPNGKADDLRKPDRRPDDLYDDAVEVHPTDPGRGRSVASTVSVVGHTETVLPHDADPYKHMRADPQDPLHPHSLVHPVGTGVGATTAAAAGMVAGGAIGASIGPIGAAVGAVVGGAIGGFVGGYAGKEIAEALNPADEHRYWQSACAHRPYVKKGQTFEDYKHAYARGVELRRAFPDRQWNDVCSHAEVEWRNSGELLPWSDAEQAMQDAWDRLTPRHPDL